MKYRDYYCGDVTFSAEKREESTRCILRVVDQAKLEGGDGDDE